MTAHLVVNPQCPAATTLEAAVAVLQRGGVVAYPTDTVYGLAVDAMQPEAIMRLYTVKGRPPAKALPVIIQSLAQLHTVALPPSALAERLMAAFWPGPLTLLLPPQARVPPLLLGDSSCIGVRWPASVLSQQLAGYLGHAITASSANRSGAPAAMSAAEVADQLAPALDLILDGGAVTRPVVSTVIDVTVNPPCLLREGKVSRQVIEATLGCRITTCSGA